MSETVLQRIANELDPTVKTPDWERIRQSRDLLEVAKFRNEHRDDPNAEEIEKIYQQLRREEYEAMKAFPWRYSKSIVEELLAQGIYTFDELQKNGLVTPESWKKVQLNREYLPDLADFQRLAVDSQPAGMATDVYFFGMPTSGKTSLLMGLAAATGQGYTIDMRANGGPYAAALRQYAQAGITPGRTPGKFVTSINGIINEETAGGKVRSHPINLIEMSGEEFALRIAETTEPSIANMGTGATNMLRNDNRKVFFIIVDASKPMVKVNYLDREIDEDGELTRQVRTRYISQLDILDKFVALMGLPENQEIMSKVDAIHFIVTKADSIGNDGNRDQHAAELVGTHYLSVVEQLKYFCMRTHRINRDYDYEPQVFTFSLGKFYLGDVFDYDSTDTLKIVDAMREASTLGKRYSWRRFIDSFRLV